MQRRLVFVVLLGAVAVFSAVVSQAQMQIYGSWHCGNDFCTWSTVRDMTDFDTKNHWLINRGDGSGLPSVNLVILSFVNPLKLLNSTTDSGNLNGVPRGMTSSVVSYFTSHNIRVMLSIGGITYTNDWDTALDTDPVTLARNAAAVAQQLGVGIEIDYEENTNPRLAALQQFITTYRSILPYDASGANPAKRLTIDLAAGDRWLIGICRQATSTWLTTSNPVLDYANAMVPNKQPNTSGAETNWQEHIDGKPTFSPPIPPLAPAKFTGSLYIVTSQRPAPECNNFSSSLENSTGTYVKTVAPNGAGISSGMLGFMFWAAECQGTHSICTTPPNTCEAGVGTGAKTYSIPLPMPALRQQ